MKPALLQKLACPFDKEDLSVKVYAQDKNGDIREGILTCPQCHRYYPIVFGVPIMSPDEYREMDLEKHLLEKWGLQLETSEKSVFSLQESATAKGKLQHPSVEED